MGRFREGWSMRKLLNRLRKDDGAILIHVALGAFMLTAFNAFVLDYGVMWLARGAAQNAADAGALSGATALALDDTTWPFPAGGIVERAATVAAQNNSVVGSAPGVVVTAACPPWMVSPNNIRCVQVDAYRDGTNGSATLPVFFARLFGTTSQSVRATATAQVLDANTSGCMRPWFIPDKFIDANGNDLLDMPPDTYTFPGYKIPDDIGTLVTFHANAGPSSYGQLDVGSGANDIRDAIEHCVSGIRFTIGQTAATKPGNNLGPEKQGIDQLLAWDPDYSALNPDGVKVDMTTGAVTGGCAASGTCACPTAAECPYGGKQSPRIVQAAICDPTQLDCTGNQPGAGTITITNILSFFILGYSNAPGNVDINAVIIGSSGDQEPGPSVGPGVSFITFRSLVR